MSEQQENNEQATVHFEDGVPVLDIKSEAERKRAEAEARDKQYKDDQITLNRRLVNATVALVAATIVLGLTSGIQLWYMHRQWKLASDGLSKTGDQVWAAKDAAFAAKQAASTGSGTLSQMQAQTKAQQGAAKAASNAVNTAKDTLHISERAYIAVGPIIPLEAPNLVTRIPFVNSGRIPSGRVEVIVHEATLAVDNPRIGGTFNDPIEKHWARTSLGSISPIYPVALVVPTPKVDPTQMYSGKQQIFIAGFATYNDGFPNTPEQRFPFCLHTLAHGLIAHTIFWTECNGASEVLHKLEVLDGYPNNEEQ